MNELSHKKDNEVSSGSTDYANDLNRLYVRSDCHNIGCKLKKIRRSQQMRLYRNKGILLVEEFLRVLRNTTPKLFVNIQAFTVIWMLYYLTNHPQLVNMQTECKSCSHWKSCFRI